jgi:aryl-alcohol dehydrogenase-like predicted oxidoreductase
VEKELLDYCGAHQIGVVAYSPMQRGLLTGKFSPERRAALAPDDHRLRIPDFQEPQFSATLALVEELKKIAQRHRRPVAQLALAWVLRRPEMTAAIVGARRPDQIAETVGASGWNLSKKDIDEVDKLLAEREKKLATQPR